MSKLLSHLSKEPFSLIVELPENSLAMAKKAVDEGADAISLHIDPEKKDKMDLISILKQIKIPVGAKLLGHSSHDEVNHLIMLGVDFVDFNINLAEDLKLRHDHVARIGALDHEFKIEDLTKLTDKPLEGVDAAVIPRQVHGKELTVGDLQQYITICLSTGLPVLVPTQKAVKTSEIPLLWDTGAKAVILTKTVTGGTVTTLAAAVKDFRSAVDSVKE